jgi:hypothetical protein
MNFRGTLDTRLLPAVLATHLTAAAPYGNIEGMGRDAVLPKLLGNLVWKQGYWQFITHLRLQLLTD